MLYFYKCTNCNTEIDKEMSMKEYTSEIECPYCNGKAEKDWDRVVPTKYQTRADGFYGKPN